MRHGRAAGLYSCHKDEGETLRSKEVNGLIELELNMHRSD